MITRTITLFTALLVLLVSSTDSIGQGAAAAANKTDRLEQRLLAVQRQMAEMNKRHIAEIKALREEIRALRQPGLAPAAAAEDEAAKLRRLAKAAKAETKEDRPKPGTVFRAGGLSLQALNPEISIVGDMVASYRDQDGVRKRSDFNFRCLGVHFESYLDPYSKFKAAVEMTPEEFELGEAYMTRYGVLPNLNLTVGKFRQQFGVVNRWHKHGLDQVDFPLALRQIFGPGGLNQTGISLDWSMPTLWNSSQELTLQVTNGENDRLFGGNSLGNPCALFHYKSYRDLSKDTYCELGLTGLFGWDDEWAVLGAMEHDALSTRVLGLDFGLLWEPTERMRYRNVEWRSELYWLNRDILAPDGSGKDALNAWGAYSYLQSKLNRNWDVGLRLDYYEPDEKVYADASLEPLAHAADNPYRWQFGPYLTWHQSPFVKWRLEYDHAEGRGMEDPEDRLMLQMILAAGPHKHERY